MSVSISPELEELINDKVASGRYSSPGEVIREGLRLLTEQEQLRKIRFEELRNEILKGVEQAERGELIPAEEVFDRILKRNAEIANGRT